MKKIFFLIGGLLFSIGLFAQVDKPITVKAPGGLLSPQEGTTEESSLLRSPGNHSLSNKNGMFNSDKDPVNQEDEEASFSMRTDNGLMTYKPKDFKPKAFTKDKEIIAEYRSDQYLGDLTTGGNYVELYCRDHEYVDGDKVRVFINGIMVENSISLGSGYHPILVKLNTGFNTIEFEALNQGTSGPNTAELRIFDDKGMEVAKKEWNLLTGGKASLIVVKQ